MEILKSPCDKEVQDSAIMTPWMLRAVYIYLALPFVIFALGWMRLYISIPAVLIVGYGLYSIMRDTPAYPVPLRGRRTWIHWGVVLLIILLVTVFSGIGRLAYQNDDHIWRNAILEALCDYDWPIYETQEGGTVVSLVYYIGYWLPAALFGKLFGLTAGHVALFLWTVLGLLLFYGIVSAYLRRYSVWVLLLFFAFSGLDIVIHLTNGYFEALSGFKHLEWARFTFQYSSFVTQLYWVFNQALPAWLFTVAILLQKNNRHMVFLLGLMPLCSALPFIGLLPIAACMALTRRYAAAVGSPLSGKARFRAWLRDTFTLPNVLCGGTSGILSVLYLFSSSRVSGMSADGAAGFHLVWSEEYYGGDYNHFFWAYISFVFFEFLIYWLLILAYQKKNRLFYVIGGTLLIVPLFAVGLGYDFCMRASIPGLLVLFLLVADTLPRMIADWKLPLLIPLLVCLLIGLRTPFNEVARSIAETAQGNRDAGSFEIMKSTNEENFVQPIENSFFFRYIAK